jgi:glycosyltransferase involved in cell wall biosynthesis
MVDAYKEAGIKKVYFLPNCKAIDKITSRVSPNMQRPYRFCTYSRVTPAKGIKEAVEAVERLNQKYGENYCTLDIYGTYLQEAHDGVKLMVAGRIMPQKKPISFIHAVKILHHDGVHIDVTWYGNSYDDLYAKKCLELIKQLGLNDFFKFVPSADNIESIYPHYDAFCLPPIYEGFSNVLCEAMCCGLPILCSRVADNPFIAHENENAFFFAPNNVDSIVKAIKKFASLNVDERLSMGTSSREYAQNQFSKDRFVIQYETLINE